MLFQWLVSEHSCTFRPACDLALGTLSKSTICTPVALLRIFYKRPTLPNRDRRYQIHFNGLTSRPELDPMLNHGSCWRLKRLTHRGCGSQAEARWGCDGASHRRGAQRSLPQ